MENIQKILELSEKLIGDLRAEPLLPFPSRAMDFAFSRERKIVILAEDGLKTQKRVQKIIDSMKLGGNAKISHLATSKANAETLPVLADGFVLLVDAQFAWNRDEKSFYEKTLATGTPIAVALVGIDDVDEDEQEDVISHVENYAGTHENAQFLTFDEFGDCDEVAGTLLRDFFEKAFAGAEFQKSRSRRVNAYFSALLELLTPQMEKLQAKEKSENEAKEEKIFKEKTNLDTGTLFWKRLNREFRNFCRITENEQATNIRKWFDKKVEADLLNKADKNPAIQEWWNNDFQKELNRWIEEIVEKVFALANAKLEKDRAYIKQKIEQNYRVPVEIGGNIDGENLAGTEVGEASAGLSKNGKLLVRGGLLVAGVVAQFFIPIPGLPMLLPNIFGELAMGGMEKSAKEAAKVEISRIVRENKQNVEAICLKSIREAYESNMQALELALEKWSAGTQEKIDAQKAVPANATITSLRENCEKLLAEIKTEIEKI